LLPLKTRSGQAFCGGQYRWPLRLDSWWRGGGFEPPTFGLWAQNY